MTYADKVRVIDSYNPLEAQDSLSACASGPQVV